MTFTISGLSSAEAARTLGVTPARVCQLLAGRQLAHWWTPLGRLIDPHDLERLRQERESKRQRGQVNGA